MDVNARVEGGNAFLPVGQVAGATVLSRWQRRLRVTAIVKATFAFVPGGELMLTAPARITAADLAPYLPQVDVLFVGRVEAARGTNVRLALASDVRPLLDKHAIVDGAGSPGLGPSGALRRHALRTNGSIVEVPDDFAWDTLQAAPRDQRLSVLRGRVWIRLEGLSAKHSVLQMALPPVRAFARIRGGAAAPQEIELRPDTILIDGDAERVSITFRAGHTIDDDTHPRLTVSGGIDLPGRPLVWPAAAREQLASGTVAVGDLESLRSPAPLPFGELARAAARGEVASSTIAVTDLEALRSRVSLPFQTSAAPAPRVSYGAAPSARESSGTLELSDDDPRTAALRAIPFGEVPSPLPAPLPPPLFGPLPPPVLPPRRTDPPPEPVNASPVAALAKAPPPAAPVNASPPMDPINGSPPAPVNASPKAAPAKAPPPITIAADTPDPAPPPKPPKPAPPGAAPALRQGLYGMFSGSDE
ncbi:Hypothetical protein A7982_11327 [Minicystis rosea]|nr:Hypothetical protein A7982_11327 [Minicystis rosea]